MKLEVSMEGVRILQFFIVALLTMLGGLVAIGRQHTRIGLVLMLLAISILMWLVLRPDANHRKED